MNMYLTPYRRRVRTTPTNRYRGTACSDVQVPMNVKAEEDAFILEIIIPGLKAEDIEIEIVEDVVDIKGEFPKVEEEDVNYLRREHPTGHFHRRVKLPTLLNVESAEAVLEQGILSLRIPKAEESMPRKIKVEAK